MRRRQRIFSGDFLLLELRVEPTGRRGRKPKRTDHARAGLVAFGGRCGLAYLLYDNSR